MKKFDPVECAKFRSTLLDELHVYVSSKGWTRYAGIIQGSQDRLLLAEEQARYVANLHDQRDRMSDTLEKLEREHHQQLALRDLEVEELKRQAEDLRAELVLYERRAARSVDRASLAAIVRTAAGAIRESLETFEGIVSELGGEDTEMQIQGDPSILGDVAEMIGDLQRLPQEKTPPTRPAPAPLDPAPTAPETPASMAEESLDKSLLPKPGCTVRLSAKGRLEYALRAENSPIRSGTSSRHLVHTKTGLGYSYPNNKLIPLYSDGSLFESRAHVCANDLCVLKVVAEQTGTVQSVVLGMVKDRVRVVWSDGVVNLEDVEHVELVR